MSDIRVGLVLSGGGAKGAYHAGVLKALNELGARVDAIAGASIGALNGAILASSPSLDEGGRRLEDVWLALAESSPLSLKVPNYFTLLASAGLRLNGLGVIDQFVRSALSAYGANLPGWLQEWSLITASLEEGILSDSPLQRLMDKYLDADALTKGLPLYVSTFRSKGALVDILSCLSAELGLSDSPDSEFIHIQSLLETEQREALLASAAIPLLFAPKQVNDRVYSDGGQGGWARMQGNTPITPLLQAGYQMVIVTHLCDASLWSRQNFPEATVLEIRPMSALSRDNGIRDLLGFDAKKIPSWMQQGYEDTMHCVGRVMKPFKVRNEWCISEKSLQESEATLNDLDKTMAAALARLDFGRT